MEKFTKFLKFAFPLHNKNKKLLYNERGMDMKDFIEWLGVNEKIAKLVVWILIVLVALIVINAALDSFGAPHYQITYKNLKEINLNKVFQYLINWITIVLSFYAIVLMVFRVKEVKNTFIYSFVFLIIDVILALTLNYAFVQLFIWIYILTFSYFYSGKNKKYIIYTFFSLIINLLMQGICYYYKVKLIDYKSVSEITKMLLFSDYFIIMGIIILVKEIYLKKRSEKNGI